MIRNLNHSVFMSTKTLQKSVQLWQKYYPKQKLTTKDILEIQKNTRQFFNVLNEINEGVKNGKINNQ